MEITLTDQDEAQAEQFAEGMFTAALGAMELANVELGLRLGLYEVLAAGPRTSAELADETGIAPRYAREWLEQQAVAGVVTVDASVPAAERVFTLPPGHAHALLDPDREANVAWAGALVPWLAQAVALMTEEFRSGKGLDFGAFALHDVQAAMTRPVFSNHLVQSWLPALPDVHGRLAAGEPLRIAEVGCGEGRAAITIAQAFPNVQIDASDPDPDSISVARKAAADAGVLDRVRFHQARAEALVGDAAYDLVLSIEMLHDVPDPVGVLAAMRALAGNAGAVLVVDERTRDDLTVDGDPMERIFYAFSTLHCLAVGMQDGGAATGTVIRASTVRDYAHQAGFDGVEVLDVEHPQFRLFRLT